MNPGIELSEEEKYALRNKRQLGLRKLGSLGLLIAGCSLLAIIIGAASIGVQASDPSPPYMLGVALVAGVLMLFAGVFAMLAARRGHEEKGDDVSLSLKCYVIAFFVICVIGITICILVALGGGVLGIVLCALEGKAKGLEDICQPNHDATLALSVLTMLLAFALFLFAVMGSCFFCFYGPTFGFKNRHQTRMERQMRRVQASELNAGYTGSQF